MAPEDNPYADELTMAQAFQRAAQIGADTGPVVNTGLIATMTNAERTPGVAVWFFRDDSVAVSWDKGVRDPDAAIVIAYSPDPIPEEG